MFGVGQKTDLFRDLNLQPVALPFQPSFLRLDCGQLWQEPAIAGLDWLFTPNHKLEEHLHVEPLQAFTKSYLRFTLLRIRSPGFRSNPNDFRHFNTCPLVNCRISLSLRMLLYRLSLPLGRTPWHVIQNEQYNSEEQYHTITARFQNLLTPCQGFFSTFPHGTCLLSVSKRI